MAPQDDDRRQEEAAKQATPDVSRRTFLKTVGATSLGTAVSGAASSAEQVRPPPTPGTLPAPVGLPDSAGYQNIRKEVADNLSKRGIVGYADRLRVQPGETITFMVSSEPPRYRADIVRLIHGDANPQGPGIKEALVDTAANARVRRQAPGSAAGLLRSRARPCRRSVSRAASPSPRGSRRPANGSPPTRVSVPRDCSRNGRGPRARGYGVCIDDQGRLTLWLADAAGRVEKLAEPQPLRPWIPAIPGMNHRPQGVATAWYFVAVSFDARTGARRDPLRTR